MNLIPVFTYQNDTQEPVTIHTEPLAESYTLLIGERIEIWQDLGEFTSYSKNGICLNFYQINCNFITVGDLIEYEARINGKVVAPGYQKQHLKNHPDY